MAKLELGKIPLFNIFFRTVDISVNRSSMKESSRAFHQASENIDKGMHLIIFPEGTIGDHPPKLMRFKNGAFRLAIEKQVPIVPITFIDNWKLLYVGGKIHGRPGIARTIVHKPISTKGMTLDDVSALRDRVHAIIEQTLKEHESK
jgi:1-acyl-sn-glycerol-3-phosphate acyltransferase